MSEESKLAEKLENQQQFTEEELKNIKEIQQEYLKIQTQFGRIRIANIRLEEQTEALDLSTVNTEKSFKELQERERKFLKEITDKYGEGSVDPETGQFTKNKSE
tara:strand:- start:1031 stop:1342 length:312 start_codon:yes stop_codon:yes gene_type:complete